MDNWFRALCKADPPAPYRDKFLARLLGLFSEEIVQIWCHSDLSPYTDLGRPRVVSPGTTKGYTLDFTFQSRQDGCCFVVEMKCWVEYQGYKYLTLEAPEQLEGLESPAFNAFLAAAGKPSRCTVTIGGKPQQVDGAILIWGDVTPKGRLEVKQSYGLFAVHSLREIIDNLVSWKDSRYRAFLKERDKWCRQLFQGLLRGSL